MKRNLLLVGCLFSTTFLFAQAIKEKLNAALQRLATDPQFEHSILAMYVVDANSGAVVFDRNGETGLAPASCLKIVTSAAAFELLGKEFRYQTYFSALRNKEGNTTLSIRGSGDPSLGSDRFSQTTEAAVFHGLIAAIRQRKIQSISALRFSAGSFSTQTIPDGWVWQDLGNYFGAGAASLNWRENQFQVVLKAGKRIGEPVEIVKLLPGYAGVDIINECKTGASGSGDKSFLYLGLHGAPGYLRGTIPQGESNFPVSGAIPDAGYYFNAALSNFLLERSLADSTLTVTDNSFQDSSLLYQHTSPGLDSLNYWFMKKSINLYGEAFTKSMGLKYKGIANTDSGVAVIKEFWQKKGIQPSSLNIIDGSGLSPGNRITCRALVQVLQYARKQDWFKDFYDALPEMNGIKMKDGYIGGVRSYSGLVKSSSGQQYYFALITNNFYGSPKTAREKMWKLLDLLK